MDNKRKYPAATLNLVDSDLMGVALVISNAGILAIFVFLFLPDKLFLEYQEAVPE